MQWQALLSPDIKTFIRENENADVKLLGLKKPPNPEWPYPLILDQIKARQKSKTKIPTWYKQTDIIFPAHNTIEQASSEACAQFKASLFKGKTSVDLTGGAGVDSWAISQNFQHTTILDIGKNTAQLIEHNLKQLNTNNISVKAESAETYVENMDQVDLAMIDPQRRNETKKGLYHLKDCTPDITSLLPKIKTKNILLKTSPMLDINEGINQLDCVSEIYVIEWQNECKELLFLLTPQSQTSHIKITAVKIDNNGAPLQNFTYSQTEEKQHEAIISPPKKYLYEPSPAFIKIGAHKSIAHHYKTPKIHNHTHIYTSDTHVTNFPGRSFEIIQIYPAQSKKIPFKKANLKARNFPQNTATLKKKLKLKDGGDDYLFACTITKSESTKDEHVLIHCKKINK